ncbi:MAG: flippase-like domain-containing protein [Candidatus Heimdallarchaeota archaeon]|nr:flippase-like domain-containing protein [Candidatus Heimdallarchaeota archaeon]
MDNLQEITDVSKEITIKQPAIEKPQKKITDTQFEIPSQEVKKGWFKKNWKFLLGIVVTVTLMTYLIYRSEPGQISKSLQEANYWYILMAFGGTILLFTIKTLRWMFILKQQGEKIPFMEAFSLILIGTFGSAITPAKVGDILRAFYLTKRRKTISTGAAVFSVVFDRILDLIGIIVVVCLSFPIIIINMGHLEWWIPASAGLGIFVFILLVIFVYNKNITKSILNLILRFISKAFKKQEAKDKLNISTQGIINDFYLSQKNYRVKHYLWLGLLSILFWVILGFQGCLLLYAFGITKMNPLIVVMTLSVAAIIAMTIPISISGVGIRDTIIVAFLGLLLALDSAIPLSLSIIQTFLNVLLPGLLGGLLILLMNQKENKLNRTKLAVG